MYSGLSQNFWINLAGFQLAWWCAVLFGNRSLPVLCLFILFHLLFHSLVFSESKVLILCGLCGFSIDLLLTLSGVFRFDTALPPLWLLLLWFCFSATLRQSLAFFNRNIFMASLCGGVFGSITYTAAESMGAVSSGIPEVTFIVLLMVIWMVLFPVLLKLSVCISKAGNYDAI